jgi:hypothetical protein
MTIFVRNLRKSVPDKDVWKRLRKGIEQDNLFLAFG